MDPSNPLFSQMNQAMQGQQSPNAMAQALMGGGAYAPGVMQQPTQQQLMQMKMMQGLMGQPRPNPALAPQQLRMLAQQQGMAQPTQAAPPQPAPIASPSGISPFGTQSMGPYPTRMNGQMPSFGATGVLPTENY